MSYRVLVYVQHLLGIGHLRRAAAVAQACALRGDEVILTSGGMPDPELDAAPARVHQLPAMRATDGSFAKLVDGDGHEVDAAFRDRRRAALLALAQTFRPDAVVTELFPFGRRQVREEVLALLAYLHEQRPRPLIVASVRDILSGRRSAERSAEALKWFEGWYDRLLVHGDPRLIRFEATFPHVTAITDRLRYTGYVVTGTVPARDPADIERGEVVVSAGGGAVGERLLAAAMEARRETPYRDRKWRLLVGHNLPEPAFQMLVNGAPVGVNVERARRDFRELLAASALSISQGGYNTVLDVMRAQTRAVIVPFAGNGEVEQTLRAERLARRDGFTVIAEADLTSNMLATAIHRAHAGKPTSPGGLDLSGAETSARLLAGWLAERTLNDQMASA